MSVLVKLLAIDDLARPHGCGLNPRLREAIEGSTGRKSAPDLSRNCARSPGILPPRNSEENVCDAQG